MLVKPEQLLSRLKSQPSPVVWISGDEPLLVQELSDTVRQFAKAEGYSEREVMDAGGSFDWNALTEATNALSLFAERKLIDLRLASPKLDNQAKAALQSYVLNPGPDNLLMISSGKIEKASQNSKWFKAIEKSALFTQVWPVGPQQMPAWIANRLASHGMSADRDAIQILADRVEGNLLAAAQEIEKLNMLVNVKELDGPTVARAVADSARFNVFGLIDACLAGNSARALKILAHLKAEGAEILQILNLLCREIRNLCKMRLRIENGQNINGVMQSERVWNNRTQIVGRALSTHTVASLQALLDMSVKVDHSVKGLKDYSSWDELLDIVLGLASGPQGSRSAANIA